MIIIPTLESELNWIVETTLSPALSLDYRERFCEYHTQSMGRLLASLANIRLSWKYAQGTNTLAYFAGVSITTIFYGTNTKMSSKKNLKFVALNVLSLIF
jgi:hypothetical protein